MFNLKDSFPKGLHTQWCTNCHVQAVMLVMMKPAGTSSHVSTSTYFWKDLLYCVFKHLQSSESCQTSSLSDCFKIVDSTTIKFQVKLKESM